MEKRERLEGCKNYRSGGFFGNEILPEYKTSLRLGKTTHLLSKISIDSISCSRTVTRPPPCLN